jgi:hypothetical protein
VPLTSGILHAGPVLTAVLTAGVLAFVGFRLVSTASLVARSAALRRRAREIVRGIRWRHVWPVPFVLTAVVLASIALLQIPPLRFGWWTAIGGLGNPVTGTTDQTAGTALEWIVPVVFLVLLVPALPLFAFREEELFRLGAEGWSTRRRIAKAARFGLVHAIIGIPIGVALALGIGGGYFQAAYLRGFRVAGSRQGGLMESARAHTAYNGIVVVVVLAAIVAAVV